MQINFGVDRAERFEQAATKCLWCKCNMLRSAGIKGKNSPTYSLHDS